MRMKGDIIDQVFLEGCVQSCKNKENGKKDSCFHGRKLRFLFAWISERMSIRTPKGMEGSVKSSKLKLSKPMKKHRQLFRGVI